MGDKINRRLIEEATASTPMNPHRAKTQRILHYDEDVSFSMVKEMERKYSVKNMRNFQQLNPSDDDVFVTKWTSAGLQIVALITEHLVSHPFVVLRRQCQVNNNLNHYHIIPVTLIPVIINIHRWQGITSLWKGVGSVLIVKGVTLAVQDLISKITLWPKDITLDSSLKSVGHHLLLKCVTCAIITPFYSASLLETVQSEIASEKPGFLDVFKEGLRRLFSMGFPQKGRMIPVWSLVFPTAVYFILRHAFCAITKHTTLKMMLLKRERRLKLQGAVPKNFNLQRTADQNEEVMSSLIAMMAADVILYPMETILHRLHLQGTRTLIDNLDSGLAVTPIITSYEGVVDCYEATIREEGVSGLYKGFGSVILQCLAYTSIVKISKFVLEQISNLFSSSDNADPILVREQLENRFAKKAAKSEPISLENRDDQYNFYKSL